MKRQDVVTVAAFMFSPSTSIGIALSFGVTSLTLSMGSVANAVELVKPVPDQIISQSSVIQRADQEKPTKAASDSNAQPASPISSQLEQSKFRSSAQKEDQVNIEDVPEICRAYFPLDSSVSLFDYQQGIERCKYGR